ncbi:MAG: RusA family crossover junction endodeoxyribonuclease [Faecousia sp.]
MRISFTVPGRPVPKQRPRVTRHGTYTPEATRNYELSVLTSWQTQSGQRFPDGAPLAVYVTAHFPIPESASKKRRAALEGAPHTQHRGDIDNVVKSVLDALNGFAFADDSAVCCLRAYKDYRTEPSTEVTILPYDENESVIASQCAHWRGNPSHSVTE